MDPVSSLQQLIGPVPTKWALAIVVALLILLSSRLLQRLVTRSVDNSNKRYRTRKAVAFISYGLLLVSLAALFADQLSGLAVAFGVAGAGIAFALQEVIASVAGWVAIAFGRFYAPGDRVQLGGIKGDVIDIGVLRTTLMEIGQWVNGDQYNGRIVRVANSFVFKEPVFNYSADFPFLWDEIRIPVRYGSDWQLAREMLARVAEEVCGDFARQSTESWKDAVRKYALEDARVEPMVLMIATDNWLEFTLRYVVDYRTRRTTKDRLFTRILEEVDRSDNRIRLASATFEIVGMPRFDVALRGGEGSISSNYDP